MWIFHKWKRILFGIIAALSVTVLTWWMVLGFQVALPIMIEYVGVK